MASVHLGVIDLPYLTAPTNAELRTYRWRTGARPWEHRWHPASAKTTGDVAAILESRYGIMRAFAEILHPDDIVKAIEGAIEDRLDNILMGAPGSAGSNQPESLLAGLDLGPVEDAFRRSIEDEEYDGILAGVPTQAALKGVNHRLKRPYNHQNPPRQSFFDTHLYHDSFKAWLEE